MRLAKPYKPATCACREALGHGLDELDELSALARRHSVLAKVVYHKLATRTIRSCGHWFGMACSGTSTMAIVPCSNPKHQRQPVFGMDSWTQSGHLCGRSLFEADRFHFRSGMATSPRRATGRAGSSGRQMATPGIRCRSRSSTPTPMAEKRLSIFTPSWVTPDNFPGYVEQEVQFRFDNGVWTLTAQARRGTDDRRAHAQ